MFCSVGRGPSGRLFEIGPAFTGQRVLALGGPQAEAESLLPDLQSISGVSSG